MFNVTLTSSSYAKSASVSESFAKHPTPVRQLSILVVEDTPAYQKFIRQILQDRGHVVTHVNDGSQALASYSQQPFDVIVVDVQMPVMNGLELARWIRSQEIDSNRRTPIIALSAHSDSSTRNEGTAVGIDAYLTKPMDAKNFVEVVEKLASPPKGAPMRTTRLKGH